MSVYIYKKNEVNFSKQNWMIKDCKTTSGGDFLLPENVIQFQLRFRNILYSNRNSFSQKLFQRNCQRKCNGKEKDIGDKLKLNF